MKQILSYFLAMTFIILPLQSARADECSIINDECNAFTVDCDTNHYLPNKYPHKIYVGPEFYHVHRTRQGGSKQKGWIYGVRAGYDYIKRFNLYWGGDVFWGQGPLKGHSPTSKLKSTFTDTSVEGRFGYTVQNKYFRHITFTPYVGYGYFEETNKFRKDAPLRIKFKNRFQYATTGFFSSVELNTNMALGLNFKTKFPYDTKCRVSDAEVGGKTLGVKDKWHYRVELPLTYWTYKCNRVVELACIPFYEYRHYGKRENFPFDFLDTKLRIYGVSFQIAYRL
ncbi:Uncharacterized protein PHSC3_001033 [Chlamydiales bacterium STE3]|nr:Uncharacterized protein PHSC3_001033 [Chlamydiales bacterium STE3]